MLSRSTCANCTRLNTSSSASQCFCSRRMPFRQRPSCRGPLRSRISCARTHVSKDQLQVRVFCSIYCIYLQLNCSERASIEETHRHRCIYILGLWSEFSRSEQQQQAARKERNERRRLCVNTGGVMAYNHTQVNIRLPSSTYASTIRSCSSVVLFVSAVLSK